MRALDGRPIFRWRSRRPFRASFRGGGGRRWRPGEKLSVGAGGAEALEFIIVVGEAREVGGEDEAEDGEQDPRELRGEFEGPAQEERSDAAHEEKKEVAKDDAAGPAMGFDRGGKRGGGGRAGRDGGLHEIFARRTRLKMLARAVGASLVCRVPMTLMSGSSRRAPLKAEKKDGHCEPTSRWET